MSNSHHRTPAQDYNFYYRCRNCLKSFPLSLRICSGEICERAFLTAQQNSKWKWFKGKFMQAVSGILLTRANR
jgi:hypothetical protein